MLGFVETEHMKIQEAENKVGSEYQCPDTCQDADGRLNCGDQMPE